ncbi:DegT/DnrJ/EryC1/StrS family aminotransferase [Candidatus Saganbacteria bacterium]|nr:DegT/DnrJ/EryC1/StrS family aminotransferase [Candidatus Saganbacteria bacterium]
MPVPFFDITRQNRAQEQELAAAINEVVASGKYILGDYVAKFEKEFAAYHGVKHALGVASGTDALHLALKAYGIKAGDEVITSPFTFVATTEAIVYCDATPVFADIDPKTFNLAPAKIEAKITKKTKAILPVHLYGQAADMPAIMAVAKKHNLIVVEDCAQATGAAIGRKKVGTTSHAGCFSFFPTKNLGCFGDGGMITTNDDKTAEEIKVLQMHGSRSTYHHDIIGYNSRLDALQAAILSVKLKSLDTLLSRRQANALFYKKALAEISAITLPFELSEGQHSFNQFTLRAPKRDRLFGYLKDKGVSPMVYYPLSLHLQKAFANLGHKFGDLPESEKAQTEVLSLPIFPELTSEERQTVVDTLKAYYKNG